MSRKPISDVTKKKLFALSGNQCNFPECTERIWPLEEDVLLGEMCHIVAVNQTGARYDPNFPKEEINSYDNIILLCPNHHTIIDKNEKKYDSKVLREMKTKHETRFYENAHLFDDLTQQEDGQINVERMEELEAIDFKISSQIITDLPKKNPYPEVKSYIPRLLTSTRSEDSFNLESKSIDKILLENNRVTILGVAGSGKSIELDQLAHRFSEEDHFYFPIKIRLNTATDQDLEELLEIEYPPHINVPEERRLILLDALDEVHAMYIDVVVRKIILYSQKYKKSKIIVSCRNNFYTTETDSRDAKLEGFRSFTINPLSEFSIYRYLNDSISNADEFIGQLRRKRFYQLLYSPFYLVSLVDFYKKEKEVPDSRRSVFEYLIRQRVKTDFNKFKNSGVSLNNYSLKIERKVEQLALVAESLGRNYLHEKEEVLELIQDNDLFEILKRTFLINKTKNESKWEFEHNNFQEYLAAKLLSNLDFKDILNFVSFAPEYTKVKPSWLNTLSFLFSLLGDLKLQELSSWILKNEPDVLVRFEKDKIPLETREQLFIELYESYEEKGIIIRNEKFEADDLAYFVSDSVSVLTYLLDKIEATAERLLIHEAVRLLELFDHNGQFEERITAVLTAKIYDSDITDDVKRSCLYTLASLNIANPETTKKILDSNSLESSQSIRAGIYKYLQRSSEYEDNLEVVIKGVELYERRSSQSETSLADEGFHLKGLYEKINRIDNIKRILNWATAYDYQYGYDRVFFELVENTLKKAISHYNDGQNEIFDLVIKLLSSFSRKYYREHGKEFKEFFKETNTELKAFKFFLNKSIESEDKKLDFSYGMAIACNENCVQYAIEEIKSGSFTESQIFLLRNVLGWDGDQSVREMYYQELLKIDPEKYFVKQIDYDALRKARREKDVELLFNREEFLQEVVKIFTEKEQKSELSWDDLYDYKKKHFNDEEMSNEIVVQTLRERARDKKNVSIGEIEELVNDEERWTWFQIHKLISLDTNNPDFIYSKTAKEFTTGWVLNNLKSADFKTAIEYKGGNNYHYRYLELYIPYFTKRLDIEIPIESYLDFLFVDCWLLPVQRDEKQREESQYRVTDFVIEKSGLDTTKERVYQNLQTEKLIPPVMQNHFELCSIHGIEGITQIILNEINSDDFSEYDKRSLVDNYLNLNGDTTNLFALLGSMEVELEFHTIEKLVDKEHDGIGNYCIEKLNGTDDSELQLRYIRMIDKFDQSISITFIRDWIIQNKRLPERWSNFETLTNHNLNYLIEIFEDAVKNKYGDDMWGNRNEYLNAVIELGSKNDTNFHIVKSKIDFWIQEFDGTKYLHYHKQRLEQLYYSAKSGEMTFEEAKKLVLGNRSDSLNQKSSVATFWERNKVMIEIILAILTILGVILAL
ncbi:MAG: HNH endonuclease [Cyclobacteriaceae bacterium]